VSTFRIGAIGIDSSHLPEFTKRIQALNESGATRCRVTRLWTDGRHDVPDERARGWQALAGEIGVRAAGTMDELLGDVDGVMVLAVNGNRHLELSLPALERGLPTYIDKPLTCDLSQARQMLDVSRKRGARCYSASSLRFAAEITHLPRADLGRLAAIDSFGPGQINPAMQGLFYYGVHAIEMVDAIWGPGVKRVSAIRLPDRDLADLEYHDGRYARLRMERRGCYDFGATVHGEKEVCQFKVNLADVYGGLVQGMTRFFAGGDAPVPLRDLVENVAVMEAGNASMERQGGWVDVQHVA